MKHTPVIISLSGKKNAGKDTVANYVESYYIDKTYLLTGHKPRVEKVAFADMLKKFCIETLGLTEQQCYGSDEDKSSPTKYLWKNTPFWHLGDTRTYMTGREVMQIFGTECVRACFGNVWADATLRGIISRNANLVIITDNRFPSEVEKILGYSRGYVIRLTRSPFEDLHESETALDDFDWDRSRCCTVQNSLMTISEQNKAVQRVLDNIFLKERIF